MRIEFALLGNGHVLLQEGETVRMLSEMETQQIEEMAEHIRMEYPEAYKALASLYRKSRRNRPYYLFRIVERFVKCNFGSYDLTAYDIDEEQWNTEEVMCPVRGQCELEDIVCRARRKKRLSKRETEIVALTAEGMTAQEIADSLGLSRSTVNGHIGNIIRKLNVKNMKQAMGMADRL